MKDFQAYVSLARSLLTFLFPDSSHYLNLCFSGYPLGKLPLTKKVLHLPDQVFTFVFSR